MKHTIPSTNLCRSGNNNLSGWDKAFADAKQTIIELKKSIRSFELYKTTGVRFPEPKKERKMKVGGEAKS